MRVGRDVGRGRDVTDGWAVLVVVAVGVGVWVGWRVPTVAGCVDESGVRVGVGVTVTVPPRVGVRDGEDVGVRVGRVVGEVVVGVGLASGPGEEGGGTG